MPENDYRRICALVKLIPDIVRLEKTVYRDDDQGCQVPKNKKGQILICDKRPNKGQIFKENSPKYIK
jgi:hypothetical protein